MCRKPFHHGGSNPRTGVDDRVAIAVLAVTYPDSGLNLDSVQTERARIPVGLAADLDEPVVFSCSVPPIETGLVPVGLVNTWAAGDHDGEVLGHALSVVIAADRSDPPDLEFTLLWVDLEDHFMHFDLRDRVRDLTPGSLYCTERSRSSLT